MRKLRLSAARMRLLRRLPFALLERRMLRQILRSAPRFLAAFLSLARLPSSLNTTSRHQWQGFSTLISRGSVTMSGA